MLVGVVTMVALFLVVFVVPTALVIGGFSKSVEHIISQSLFEYFVAACIIYNCVIMALTDPLLEFDCDQDPLIRWSDYTLMVSRDDNNARMTIGSLCTAYHLAVCLRD